PPRVESEPKIDHPRRLESPLTLAVSLTQVAPEPTRRTAIPQPAPDSGSDQTIRDSTPATVTRPLLAPPDPLPATIFPARTAPSSTVGPSLANGFSRPASEPPAPSINVTIGRVEVRAIFEPPAKAAPPTKPEPKLSLEDYLRASTGGRR
ncbi:MAG TPA: hypothetical protein PKD98_26240, partial [Anaerolineae bacterium]|nr:hypothetical protein [Anaerolineae bacterium]